ncbi:MAG: cytochrome c oxidase subunit 4 [Candidatus Eremiobacteraeota bacterium]|nr:cytochrome c oxidase subunit 4 [Candidatus Eremiobacteraeota bacterium]
MITGRRLFVSSAVFGIVIAIVHWFSSRDYDGTILLGVMATALAFAASYMFVAEREAQLVGDRKDASNADVKGERLGVFTVATPWSLLAAFGACLLLIGLAVFPVLGVAGGAVLGFGLFQLVRESR